MVTFDGRVVNVLFPFIFPVVAVPFDGFVVVAVTPDFVVVSPDFTVVPFADLVTFED